MTEHETRQPPIVIQWSHRADGSIIIAPIEEGRFTSEQFFDHIQVCLTTQPLLLAACQHALDALMLIEQNQHPEYERGWNEEIDELKAAIAAAQSKPAKCEHGYPIGTRNVCAYCLEPADGRSDGP